MISPARVDRFRLAVCERLDVAPTLVSRVAVGGRLWWAPAGSTDVCSIVLLTVANRTVRHRLPGVDVRGLWNAAE